MGSITFTVVGNGGVGTRSKTFDVPDAHVTRIVNWAKAAYATPPTAEVPNPPALTNAQAFNAWATGVMDGTKANVVSHEREAGRAAVAEPTPITAT
jgi:hypothetical protein